MQSKSILIFSLFCSYATADVPLDKSDNCPEKIRALAVDNAHAIDQKIIFTPPHHDPSDCTQLQGKQFMDCMACQSPENLKKNIMLCNDRMARHYFLNLTIEEYHEMLEHFTEQEWQAFYASRKQESQPYFPDNKEAQNIMLKTVYLDACYNFLQQLWYGQSPLKTDDLEQIIGEYNAQCIRGNISKEAHLRLLTQFHLHRKHLFAKRSEVKK